MILPIRPSRPAEDRMTASGQLGWYRERIASLAELAPIVADFKAKMRRAGYPESDLFGLALAVEEAVANACTHGRRHRPTELVCVSYQVGPDQTLVEVEDPGPGFDPRRVPDPRAEDNRERPSGRGLLLMRTYTTWLEYHDRGNRVTLCRARSKGEGSQSRGA